MSLRVAGVCILHKAKSGWVELEGVTLTAAMPSQFKCCVCVCVCERAFAAWWLRVSGCTIVARFHGNDLQKRVNNVRTGWWWMDDGERVCVRVCAVARAALGKLCAQ